MRTRSARLLALSAVVGIAGSVVALAGPNRSLESKGFTLVEASKSGATVRCPHGLRATGGGFSAPLTAEFPTSTETAASAPRGGRRWRADVLSFDPDRPAKAWGICSKAPGTKRVRSKTGFTTASQYALAGATCPSGTKLIGGGAETKGARRIIVIASAPGAAEPGHARRTWAALAFASQPDSDQSLVTYAICQPHAGEVKIRSQTKEAGPGRPAPVALERDEGQRRGTRISDRFRLDCPKGFQLTSGGFASADLNASYDSMRPRGNTWSIDLRHYTHSQPVTAYALCRED